MKVVRINYVSYFKIIIVLCSFSWHRCQQSFQRKNFILLQLEVTAVVPLVL